MPNYGVTPEGYVPKRLDTIMAEIYEELKAGWGFDPTVNPQSLLNVLVTSYSDKIATLWEVGQDIYYSRYPSSADGINLDNAMQFGGSKRKRAAKTSYTILCEGDDETPIPTTTMIASDTLPVVNFLCAQESSIITRKSFNKIAIRVLQVQNSAAYTISIGGSIYTHTSGVAATEATILEGLAQAITDLQFTATVVDGALLVEDTNTLRSSLMTLSDNLTTKSVSSLISFLSEAYGKFVLPEGSITKIVTGPIGFRSCVNVGYAIYGREDETDVEARQSYIQKIALRSNTMLDSITGAILENVNGVESARGYENDSDVTDADGRPPHSIEIVVDGGNETEIAAQILAKKAGGIGTYGSIEIIVTGVSGEPITIRFNRPQFVYVWLKVTLTPSGIQPMPPNFAELVRDSIVRDSQSLKAGESILTQVYYSGIYTNVSGVGRVLIEAYATTNSEEGAPAIYDLENVDITSRQKASISRDRIEVV